MMKILLPIVLMASSIALSAQITDPDSLWASAADARDAGNYVSALSLLNQALQLADDDAPLYNSRGKTYFDMALSGRYQSDADTLLEYAFQDYCRTIDLHPADTLIAEALINRGAVWGVRAALDNALADLNEGIRLDPSNPNGYFNRSIVYMNRQQYDSAIADYDQYLLLRPKDDRILYERGMLNRSLGRNDEAISDLDRAIALNPEKGFYYLERGRAYAQKGKIKKARADYAEAEKRGQMQTDLDRGLLLRARKKRH